MNTPAPVAITTVRLHIPITTARIAAWPHKLQIVLRQQEQHRLEAIRKALRFLNVELQPDRPVVTQGDALRWILSQLDIPTADPRQ